MRGTQLSAAFAKTPATFRKETKENNKREKIDNKWRMFQWCFSESLERSFANRGLVMVAEMGCGGCSLCGLCCVSVLEEVQGESSLESQGFQCEFVFSFK